MAATARRQLVTMTLQWARKAANSAEYIELARILLELTGSKEKTSVKRTKLAPDAVKLLGKMANGGK